MTDQDLRDCVEQALVWARPFDGANIIVSVDRAVVTLEGHVACCAGRLAAERVTRRVYGVDAVINGLDVHLSSDRRRPDAEIAVSVQAALAAHRRVDHEGIRVTVSGGWVILEGRVNLPCQYAIAEYAVSVVAGVRGIINRLVVERRAGLWHTAA